MIEVNTMCWCWSRIRGRKNSCHKQMMKGLFEHAFLCNRNCGSLKCTAVVVHFNKPFIHLLMYRMQLEVHVIVNTMAVYHLINMSYVCYPVK